MSNILAWKKRYEEAAARTSSPKSTASSSFDGNKAPLSPSSLGSGGGGGGGGRFVWSPGGSSTSSTPFGDALSAKKKKASSGLTIEKTSSNSSSQKNKNNADENEIDWDGPARLETPSPTDSADHMDQILSPDTNGTNRSSFDSNNNDNNAGNDGGRRKRERRPKTKNSNNPNPVSPSSSNRSLEPPCLSLSVSSGVCSADSIIRRVEEEIAAAKKAAATARSRLNTNGSSGSQQQGGDHDDDNGASERQQQQQQQEGGGGRGGDQPQHWREKQQQQQQQAERNQQDQNQQRQQKVQRVRSDNGEETRASRSKDAADDDDDDDDLDMRDILNTESGPADAVGPSSSAGNGVGLSVSVDDGGRTNISDNAAAADEEDWIDMVKEKTEPSPHKVRRQENADDAREEDQNAFMSALDVIGEEFENDDDDDDADASSSKDPPGLENNDLDGCSTPVAAAASVAKTAATANGALDGTEQRKEQPAGEDSTDIAFDAAESVVNGSGADDAGKGSPAQPGQRARSLLGSLKERRESFTTSFRDAAQLNGSAPNCDGGDDDDDDDPLPDSLHLDMNGCKPGEAKPKKDEEKTVGGKKIKRKEGDREEEDSKKPSELEHAAAVSNSSEFEEKKEENPSSLQQQSGSKSQSSTINGKGRKQRYRSSGSVSSIDNSTSRRPSSGNKAGTASSNGGAAISQAEDALYRKSRRIRFRDPFPILKPTNRPRLAEEIIETHSVPVEDDIKVKWLRPKNDLRQLIVAVMGSSLQRRSNACGALKVLTRQKKNQMAFIRTDSFLEAIVFAASQDIPAADRELAIDARTRAVACLRNCCEPKDNRLYIMKYPGFKECLLKVIRGDPGEARVLACGAFALLAKTPECRDAMVSTEGMVDLLSEVMCGALEDDDQTRSIETDENRARMGATLSSDTSHSAIDGALSNDLSHLSKESNFSGRDDEDDSDDESHHDGDDDMSSAYSSSSSSSSESEGEDSNLGTGGMGDLLQLNSIRQYKEEMRGEFQERARSNACAGLLHLSKHCSVSVRNLKVSWFQSLRNWVSHVSSSFRFPARAVLQHQLDAQSAFSSGGPRQRATHESS